MSLSDLASIGSLISSIAVLVSLVYLAQQIRQSARNQRAAIHTERTALVQEIVLSATSPEHARLMIRGGAGDASLSEEESSTYLGHTLCTLRLFEEMFLQHRDGMLDEARWENNALRVRGFFHQVGFRAAWRANAAGFDRDFAQWMDGLLQEIPAMAGPSQAAAWKAFAKEELAQ